MQGVFAKTLTNIVVLKIPNECILKAYLFFVVKNHKEKVFCRKRVT